MIQNLTMNGQWLVGQVPGIHAVLNGISSFCGTQSLAYDAANRDLSMIEKSLTSGIEHNGPTIMHIQSGQLKKLVPEGFLPD